MCFRKTDIKEKGVPMGKRRKETEAWLRRLSASIQHHLLSIYSVLCARGPLAQATEKALTVY